MQFLLGRGRCPSLCEVSFTLLITIIIVINVIMIFWGVLDMFMLCQANYLVDFRRFCCRKRFEVYPLIQSRIYRIQHRRIWIQCCKQHLFWHKHTSNPLKGKKNTLKNLRNQKKCGKKRKSLLDVHHNKESIQHVEHSKQQKGSRCWPLHQIRCDVNYGSIGHLNFSVQKDFWKNL